MASAAVNHSLRVRAEPSYSVCVNGQAAYYGGTWMGKGTRSASSGAQKCGIGAALCKTYAGKFCFVMFVNVKTIYLSISCTLAIFFCFFFPRGVFFFLASKRPYMLAYGPCIYKILEVRAFRGNPPPPGSVSRSSLLEFWQEKMSDAPKCI